MVALLKRLTDLSVVPQVLQSPAQYRSTQSGFTVDRQKLQGDVNKITITLNRNVHKYGNKKYAG